MHPLFDIVPEHIAALNDEDLRILIGRLCEAELRRHGLPVTAVTYGGSQIAPDGGIDVRVELPDETDVSGAIPRPNTGFQAKAEDMPAGKIANEMRPSVKTAGGLKRQLLRDRIKQLASKNGSFVIVCSKGSTEG